MKSLPGGDLAKVLEKNGWRLLRIRGSHHIYGKEGFTARISVPVHGGIPMKIGLFLHLLKMAGLCEKDCET